MKQPVSGNPPGRTTALMELRSAGAERTLWKKRRLTPAVPDNAGLPCQWFLEHGGPTGWEFIWCSVAWSAAEASRNTHNFHMLVQSAASPSPSLTGKRTENIGPSGPDPGGSEGGVGGPAPPGHEKIHRRRPARSTDRAPPPTGRADERNMIRTPVRESDHVMRLSAAMPVGAAVRPAGMFPRVLLRACWIVCRSWRTNPVISSSTLCPAMIWSNHHSPFSMRSASSSDVSCWFAATVRMQLVIMYSGGSPHIDRGEP